jgi:hypothetical protein
MSATNGDARVDFMIVTGAFLAERAFAENERLHTVGAVWDHYDVPRLPADALTFALVVLLQAAPETRDHTVIPTRLLDPDGAHLLDLRVDVTSRRGTEIGFAIATVEFAFQQAGRHLFVIEPANGHGATLPLHVRLV